MSHRLKLLAITVAATALASCAVPGQAATSYAQADVLSSTPIYRVVESSSPRQECWQEDVVRQVRGQSHGSATPGLLGAVIGGALGNAVGHNKSNKRVGAVVGAVLGGSIGHNIGRANHRGQDTVYVDTVERCRTVQVAHQEEKLVGYDVRYRYNGADHTVRMPQDPGPTVQVRVNVEPVY